MSELFPLSSYAIVSIEVRNYPKWAVILEYDIVSSLSQELEA